MNDEGFKTSEWPVYDELESTATDTHTPSVWYS